MCTASNSYLVISSSIHLHDFPKAILYAHINVMPNGGETFKFNFTIFISILIDIHTTLDNIYLGISSAIFQRDPYVVCHAISSITSGNILFFCSKIRLGMYLLFVVFFFNSFILYISLHFIVQMFYHNETFHRRRTIKLNIIH